MSGASPHWHRPVAFASGNVVGAIGRLLRQLRVAVAVARPDKVTKPIGSQYQARTGVVLGGLRLCYEADGPKESCRLLARSESIVSFAFTLASRKSASTRLTHSSRNCVEICP